MTIEIRNIREDELPAFMEAMGTGFLDRVDGTKVAAEVAPLWDFSRIWSGFDGDTIVGTFRTWATELTVPGGAQLPASAVTNVTVLPTHRRRGILRGMAAAEHRASRDRGEAAALLYAAEYPIYGHFGYGVGTTMATWTLSTRLTTFNAPSTGTIRLEKPSAEAGARMRDVYEAWRVGYPGEIKRRSFRWDLDLGLRDTAWGTKWKGFVAFHRNDAGDVDGYVRYRAEEKWEQNLPRAILTVDDLHALNDGAYNAIWRFLGEVDLVTTVKAEFRRSREPLPWLLTNARAAHATDVTDAMWVRLFDLPRALAARTYEREADLVLEAIDEEAPSVRIRVALHAGSDGATARETSRSADLTLHVSALSAAYLGGTRLRDAVRARGWDEHRAGALAEADAVFRTSDEPWSSTFF